MWQFALISELPYFCVKNGHYVAAYKSKIKTLNKNTTQDNLTMHITVIEFGQIQW